MERFPMWVSYVVEWVVFFFICAAAIVGLVTSIGCGGVPENDPLEDLPEGIGLVEIGWEQTVAEARSALDTRIHDTAETPSASGIFYNQGNDGYKVHVVLTTEELFALVQLPASDGMEHVHHAAVYLPIGDHYEEVRVLYDSESGVFRGSAFFSLESEIVSTSKRSLSEAELSATANMPIGAYAQDDIPYERVDRLVFRYWSDDLGIDAITDLRLIATRVRFER